MAKKQFKAESKRLLDMMIHSIYTHKEIFLRELISNASDAIDKAYFLELSDGKGVNRSDYSIRITADKEARTLTISDNGVGFTAEDMEKNLGVIASSGTLAFQKELESKDEVDLIGQFGVGFYSAFMVASKITVNSRARGSEEAFSWQSSGVDGYTITPCDKETQGTDIILTIIEDGEEERYGEYLEEYRLRSLIKKYSDYIRYPILMEVEKTNVIEPGGEGKDAVTEKVREDETLNSMIPLWKKQKSEITEDEYNGFYTDRRFGFDKPLRVIHGSADGSVSFTALLFVPGETPYDFYTKDFEKGLALYAKGVMIMEKCSDLLPDYFAFMKGLIDSEDLSLNISREMLQQDRQLKVIEKWLSKKIKSELLALQKADREGYEKFFAAFGKQLKFGVYSDFGMNKDLLQDLLLFHSSTEKKLTTLEEYKGRMSEEQKYIYYACGDSVERIDKLPQTERLKDAGIEILYLTDDVDEFALQAMREFGEKPFKNVSSGNLELPGEEEKKDEETNKEHEELLAAVKEAIGDKVSRVTVTDRLKSHPVCLSSDGALSIEMEKVLAQMPGEEAPKSQKVLELNPNHAAFETISKLRGEDEEKFKRYAKVLFNQALIIEGLPVEDPVEFANDVSALLF